MCSTARDTLLDLRLKCQVCFTYEVAISINFLDKERVAIGAICCHAL